MKNLFNRSAILVIAAIAAAFCAPRIASGQCAIIAPNVGGAPGLNIIPPANPGCSGDVFIAVCAYTAGFSMRLHNFTTDVISGPLSVSGCSGGYGCGYNCVYRGFTGITPGAYAIYMYTDPFNDTVPCVSFPFEMPSHEPNDVMTLTLDGTNSVIPAEPCQTGLLKVNCGIPAPNCLNPPTGRCYLNDQPNGPWIDGVLTNGQLVFAGLPAADNYFVVASAGKLLGQLGGFPVDPQPIGPGGLPLSGRNTIN